jgi:uncharacterized caspase-like protein
MLLRLCLALTWIVAAFAEPAMANKLAFVAGINDYPNLPRDRQLERAVSDAEAVGDALESVGFKVTRLIKGATLEGFLRDFGQFTRAIEPGDTAVLFFAGHGVALNDGNYLIPADMRSQPDEDIVKRFAIAERDIKHRIVDAGALVAVVVIDACRDNPFSAEGKRALGSASRGLGRPEPAQGVFTLYSAREGQTALDRLSGNDPSPNSVFTRVFVEKLKEPGLNLSELGDEVRDEVAALTKKEGHNQVPAVYNELLRSRTVFLAGGLLPKPLSSCGESGAMLASLPSRAAGPLSPAEECALKPKDVFKCLSGIFLHSGNPV